MRIRPWFPWVPPRSANRSAAVPQNAAPLTATRLVGTVFLPFAAGYLLSYFFRTVNALIAPELTVSLGLTAASLGLITAAYFLPFAVAQVPLGIALDRFGPRRVQATLLLFASAGALLFAFGQTTTDLIWGRALIGFGVSGALMAGLKAIAEWVPTKRISVANGLFIMFGGLGAYAAAGPSERFLQTADWRMLFVCFACASGVLAAIVFFVVPERRSSGPNNTISQTFAGLKRVYNDRFFWSIAPASGCAIGAAWSAQGLWAGRWLSDVEHLSRDAVVDHLSAMAAAFCVASLVWGFAINHLRSRGWPPRTIMAGALGSFVLLQILIVCRAPLPSYVVWAAFGCFASATVFGYTLLAEHFPKEFTGRANTALNLIHMGAAFAFQAGIGAVLDWLPREAGRDPTAAYQVAFALPLMLQFLSLLWMVACLRPIQRTPQSSLATVTAARNKSLPPSAVALR